MDYGRPPRQQSLPLPLLCEAFGQFIDDMQTYTPTKEDNDFASRVREEMLKVHHVEGIYAEEFRQLWNAHVPDFQIHPGGSAYNTNGHVRMGRFCLLITEGKRELDGMRSDPLLQLSMYYIRGLHETRRGLGDKNEIQYLFPCLLIYYAGPYIGFAGAVHTDMPQIEVLTPFYPVHANPHDSNIISQVTRALAAAKKAMTTLKRHYSELPNRVKQGPLATSSSDSLSLPYRTHYTVSSTVSVNFRYIGRVDETRLVFRAQDTEDRPLIVKFTRKYSKEAHEHCARFGVTPALHAVEKLPGGWIMVVMDYLEAETYEHPEVPLSASESVQLRERIDKAMNKLHEGGFVHGDLRSVNLMVRKGEIEPEQGLGVMILDFDWAGEEGKVCYPPNVNTEFFRPEGVQDNAPIKRMHDEGMIRHMFGETTSVAMLE